MPLTPAADAMSPMPPADPAARMTPVVAMMDDHNRLLDEVLVRRGWSDVNRKWPGLAGRGNKGQGRKAGRAAQ